MNQPLFVPKNFHSISRRLKTALRYGVAILQRIENKKAYLNCMINDKPGIIHLRNGLKIEIQGKRCIGFLNSIFFNKIYGTPKDEQVIIDIGANKGLFSVFFANELKGKEHKIFAFEPHPNTFQLLERNIKNNQLDKNILTFQKCVSGASTDTQSFFVARESFDYSLYNEYQTNEKVVVENITLQEIIDQNSLTVIDLLKMNCEGAEYEILFKTEKSYLKKIRAIRMEYHNFELDGKKYDLVPLIDYLEENQFSIVNQLPYAPEHGIIWFENKKGA